MVSQSSASVFVPAVALHPEEVVAMQPVVPIPQIAPAQPVTHAQANPVQQVAPAQQAVPVQRIQHQGRSYFLWRFDVIAVRVQQVFEKFVAKIALLGLNMSFYAGSLLLFSWSASFFSLGLLNALVFPLWTQDKLEIFNRVTKKMFVEMEIYKIFCVSILFAAAPGFTLSFGAYLAGSYFGNKLWQHVEEFLVKIIDDATDATLEDIEKTLIPTNGPITHEEIYHLIEERVIQKTESMKFPALVKELLRRRVSEILLYY